MPRTKLAEKAKPAAHIVANIAYYAQMYDYDAERIAAVMHVSRATWFARKQRPECFTIAELQRLANSFHVPITELILRRDRSS